MKCVHMLCHLVLVLCFAVSSLGAPVKQPDTAEVPATTKTKNEENTANELEELTQPGNVILPAAPIVTESEPESENLQQAVSQLQQQQPQPQAPEMNMLHVSGQLPPVKRQFPMPGSFAPGNRRFPAYSPDQEDLMQVAPRQPDVDLSPRAVAEYLLVTTDFNGFDQAMADLTNIGVLSPREVMQYKDSVSYEYEVLLRQMAQSESEYLQDLSRVSPLDYFNTIQQPAPSYPEYPFNQNSLEYSDQTPDQLPQLMGYGDQGYQRQVGGYGGDRMQQPDLEQMLAEKQKTLDDELNMVLQQYYANQQDNGDMEYNDEEPEELPSYEKEPEDDNDDTMKQFMAYLQQTLTAETTGAGIIEIPDKYDEQTSPDKTEHIDDADVAKELDDLSDVVDHHTMDHQDITETDEEGSGDVDTHPLKSW